MGWAGGSVGGGCRDGARPGRAVPGPGRRERGAADGARRGDPGGGGARAAGVGRPDALDAAGGRGGPHPPVRGGRPHRRRRLRGRLRRRVPAPARARRRRALRRLVAAAPRGRTAAVGLPAAPAAHLVAGGGAGRGRDQRRPRRDREPEARGATGGGGCAVAAPGLAGRPLRAAPGHRGARRHRGEAGAVGSGRGPHRLRRVHALRVRRRRRERRSGLFRWRMRPAVAAGHGAGPRPRRGRLLGREPCRRVPAVGPPGTAPLPLPRRPAARRRARPGRRRALGAWRC